MCVPGVAKIAHEAGRVAKRLAPPTKTWLSMGDDRVRMPHVHADGDELPDNLRFKLTAFAWDLEHPGAMGSPVKGTGAGKTHWQRTAATVPGRYSYLLFPRDPSAGAYIQVVNCRCGLEVDPNGVAKMIRVQEPKVVGAKVTAKVIAEGPYVVEAERGDVYEDGLIAEGTWFMRRMVAEMGARGRR